MGQFILQAHDLRIAFGDLQRQHLNVLGKRASEPEQLGHLGAADGPEFGFEGADALLQGVGRRSTLAGFSGTKLGEKIGNTVRGSPADTCLTRQVSDGQRAVGALGSTVKQSCHRIATGLARLVQNPARLRERLPHLPMRGAGYEFE
ncbi:hypothetical protein QA641_06115 [Bradyrhizobium sp. CB1650]|uniref:hypothetical protein n=1 Tax=Bradyrhizobium sp. CB1650 TaxID=3039153 RepID=UPI002435C621|nr:hypothetical protein [Bradyrhizobium sp. CB1650]WGD53489.1 hypothetical protein QA641_06115 [Bradyrhizobium sp. CB1650]